MIVIGASVSGSVMVVSSDVFMTEVSNSELASGDMDRRPTAGWEAGALSCVAVSIREGGSRACLTGRLASVRGTTRWGVHTSCACNIIACFAVLSTAALPSRPVALVGSEHSFFTTGCCAASSSSKTLFLGVATLEPAFRGDGDA